MCPLLKERDFDLDDCSRVLRKDVAQIQGQNAFLSMLNVVLKHILVVTLIQRHFKHSNKSDPLKLSSFFVTGGPMK